MFRGVCVYVCGLTVVAVLHEQVVAVVQAPARRHQHFPLVRIASSVHPCLLSFFLSSSFLVTFTCCRLTLSFRIESKSNLHAEPHFRGDPFKVRRHLNALYLIIWHTLMCLVFVKDFINLNVVPIHPSIIQPSYGSQVHWRLIPAHENVLPYLENLTQPKNPQQVLNPTS